MGMYKKQTLDDVIIKAKWATEYIIAYRKDGEAFDPFAILTGTESKRTKLFRECCDYLQELAEVAERFEETRKKYL